MYKIVADRICVDLNFYLLFFRKRLKCVYCATKIVPLFTNWEKQSEKKASSFVKIEVGATKISAYASIFVAPTSILSKLSAFFSDCFSQFVNKGTIITSIRHPGWFFSRAGDIYTQKTKTKLEIPLSYWICNGCICKWVKIVVIIMPWN